ncbi:TetR/AcrR family transcriptional regulator [Yinghuangia soli]|uniref:TetR/AcrR family transcriptional regulator n=1 Tax=Yinghuangia soli TaxID=2908204 RepID=A0AA41U429_9ACTN|nr:TetR/AcrR family transcriptional regulator [Yinghuangia soli]MCF2533353.1 TetR/AcrR family transcriptional regulator [Yinghuangia soli]
MGAIRTPRGKWVEEGLRALGAGGPEAVRIEVLAQALGVSKGGFYGYFRNREALLDEMLDTWEHEITEAVIEQVEADGGDAREKLARLFGIAAAAVDAPTRGVAADLAIREWARRDPGVAERLRRTDNRRMDYLRSLFREFVADEADVERRSMIVFTLRIGNFLMAADPPPGTTRGDVLRDITAWLLD